MSEGPQPVMTDQAEGGGGAGREKEEGLGRGWEGVGRLGA